MTELVLYARQGIFASGWIFLAQTTGLAGVLQHSYCHLSGKPCPR